MDMLDEVYNQVTPKVNKFTKPKRIAPSKVNTKKTLNDSAEGDSDWKLPGDVPNYTESKQPLAMTANKAALRPSGNQKEAEQLINTPGRGKFMRLQPSRRTSANMRKTLMQAAHDPSLQTSDYNPNRTPPDWDKVKLHTVSSQRDTTGSKQSR